MHDLLLLSNSVRLCPNPSHVCLFEYVAATCVDEEECVCFLCSDVFGCWSSTWLAAGVMI